MNDEQRHLAKQLFLVACELTEDRATRFLDQACGQDSALRAEVGSLLQHHRPETILSETTESLATDQIVRPFASPANLAHERPVERQPRVQLRNELPPGDLFAGRYRILCLLGRGGMADVYQAEDERIRQVVAVKILSADRSRKPKWIDRFYSEVRLSRSVTHPNVVRTFDVGQAEDALFLTMEYIDGEDLESLLRRVGRLSAEKTIQLTRELCAGLAAAHEQGVLHRDLKPANVMVDLNGRARITDFGIAGSLTPTATDSASETLGGTPAYMAPELFAGARPTIQSDLYSLGLLVYRSVTGREAFGSAPPWRREATAYPPAPSSIAPGIPPALDEVVEACLMSRPELRPSSAYEVAASLPGADLLDEQLESGRTPSPDLVAAAQPPGGSGKFQSAAWLAAMLVGLAVVVGLADHTFLIPQTGLNKPPAVLEDRAEYVLDALGYGSLARSNVQLFELNRHLLHQLAGAADRPASWDWLATESPPAVLYWYRRGDLEPSRPPTFGDKRLVQPPSVLRGVVSIKLDGKGRLVELIVPSDVAVAEGAGPARGSPAWDAIFPLTGLDAPSAELTETAPVRVPPVFADRVKAWSGRYPGRADVEIRLEAAAIGDRIVFVDVVPIKLGDVTDLVQVKPPTLFNTELPLGAWITVILVSLVGAIVLAWRNYRLGYGDRRGALRLSLVVLIMGLIDWLVGEPHVWSLVAEFASAAAWWSTAVFNAAAMGVCYLAAEPYARRLEPRMMVTWSRLVAGRFRDSLFGRHLLIGTVAGLAMIVIEQADTLSAKWLATVQPLPKLPVSGYVLGEMLGLRYKIGTLVGTSISAVLIGFVLLVLFLLIRAAVRHRLVALIVFWLVVAGLVSLSVYVDSHLPMVIGALSAALLTGLLLRVGLVALITSIFVRQFLFASPVTASLDAWYAPASIFAVLVVLGLGGGGFYLHASQVRRHRRLQSHAALAAGGAAR